MGIAFLRWTPWALAAAAGVLTVSLLLAQIRTQDQLNVAMQGVRANVAQAKDLTAETARVLSPLAATADTLAAMNQGLEVTVGDLQAMNESMGRVLVRQEAVLARIDSLNGHTGTVVADLGVVGEKNQALLGASRAMTAQTVGQAGSVEELAGLTGVSISHLSLLNDRFAFLSQY
jgi:division protein CdvB (Snf7/Vps24/ESCRT-III family)